MTATQLNAELLRNMSIIAEDESLLKRAARYLRKLVAEKQADPTEYSKEDFLAKIDNAKREIAEGKYHRYSSVEDLDKYIRSL